MDIMAQENYPYYIQMLCNIPKPYELFLYHYIVQNNVAFALMRFLFLLSIYSYPDNSLLLDQVYQSQDHQNIRCLMPTE